MKRVLIVDDVRLLAELETTPVGRACVEVVVLAAEQDVVDTARAVEPDVIVLEEGEFFPEAFEALRQLRAHGSTAQIPVVFIGVGLSDRARLARSPGVFLPKPVTRLELRQALMRVLGLPDRVATRLDLDLETEAVFPGGALRGRCRDLSLSGAFLVLERAPKVGERGLVQINVGGRALQLAVEVVRHGQGRQGIDSGTGVRFVEQPVGVGAFLSRYVRRGNDRRSSGGAALAREQA